MKCYLFDLSKIKFNINMLPSSNCLFSVILGYTNCIFFNVISQVNKPYLPLASGEYSVKTGVIIVSSFAILVWKFEILNLVVYTQAICVCGFLFHGLKLLNVWLSSWLKQKHSLFYCTEFLARMDCWFMAFILGSFRQFCAWNCIFYQCELFLIRDTWFLNWKSL